MDWTKVSEQRPPNAPGRYRFRVTANVLGMMLTPEWTAEMRLCGMGVRDNEWWPGGTNHWDGYKRYFTDDYEWREILPEDPEGIVWGGLDLLPCPFTGKPPVVDYCGLWIGAPPHKAEWLRIKSHLVNSTGWKNPAAMMMAWNARPEAG